MNPNSFTRLFAMALLSAALPAWAQDTNAPGSRTPPGERRPFAAPMGPGRFGETLMPVLNILSEEQRASVIQGLQSDRENFRQLEIKIRDGRRALIEATATGKFDEEATRKQAMALASLEAERTVLGLKALSKVQPPLSPEQIERIRNLAPLGAARGGPRAGIPDSGGAGRGRTLTNTNRDANDLPPKQ